MRIVLVSALTAATAVIPNAPADAADKTFAAVADATVRAERPNSGDGASTTLASAQWPEVRSYLRFEVTGISGSVKRATISLRAQRASATGFEVYLARGDWNESSVDFANAPTLVRVVDSSKAYASGDTIRLDMTSVVREPGTYTFAIVTSAARSVAVSSRESSRPPKLTVTTGAWCSGVRISPGDSIQAAIDREPDGTTFCLQPGVHRLRKPLEPNDGQRFIGEDGAIVNGSRVIDSWNRDGGLWFAGADPPALDPSAGFCQKDGYTGCTLPERVYLDGDSLWQVETKAQVANGTFFFDRGARRVYLADDPTGHRVEVSMATSVFVGWSGKNVEVRNLVFEQFGTPGHSSTLGTVRVEGWRIVGNEVRNNGGIGLCAGPRTKVIGNYVHDQGQLGLCGQLGHIVFENNTVSHNNVDGFRLYWEAGGSKWVNTDDLLVYGNYSHDNRGFGLWTDGNNIRTTYANNRVEDNAAGGILHEISYAATIRDNFVAGNGHSTSGALDGAGVFVVSSKNVEVFHNAVIDNADGIGLKQNPTGSGEFGPLEVERVRVHHNAVVMCEGETGALSMDGTDAIFNSNNVFASNRYFVGGSRSQWWRWMGDFRTEKQWTGYGHDQEGSFKRASC